MRQLLSYFREIGPAVRNRLCLEVNAYAYGMAGPGRDALFAAAVHRLSTIRAAGRIVSIADGIITETGTHQELMTKGGMYSQLYKTQTDIARQM